MNAAALALKLSADQSLLYKNLPALKERYINLDRKIISKAIKLLNHKYIFSGLRSRRRKK